MRDLTGTAASPFSLHDINGVEHSLEDFHGNWLLMVFHRHLG
jgi:peroxiredoxin